MNQSRQDAEGPPSVRRRDLMGLSAAAVVAGASTFAKPAAAQQPPASPEGNDTVTVERSGAMLLIGLNRQAHDNKIDPEMYRRLAKEFYEYEHDASLRVMVIFGHGASFCKGLDVEAFAASVQTGDAARLPMEAIDPMQRSGMHLKKPVVAVAHGDTWNAGHELFLAADIRIAAAGTTFRQMENTQARFPAGGATVRFVRDAGWANAMRYMLTGESWSDEEARRMNLISEIGASPREALAKALLIAERVATCAPRSIQTT